MGESIRYIPEKLKTFLSDDAAYFTVLLVLVGCLSFTLGQQSMRDANSATLSPTVQYLSGAVAVPLQQGNEAALASSEEQPVASAASTKQNPNATTVIASKNGTKYHLPTCPGAKQIKPENAITFASVESAKAAGFEPAKNCQF